MVHFSTTISLLEKSTRYFDPNPNESFYKRHIEKRGAHLGIAPCFALTSVVDIIIGLGAGAASLLTAGTQPKITAFVVEHLASSAIMGPAVYHHLERAINPGLAEEVTDFKPIYFLEPLTKAAREFSSSKHFLQRHVTTRLTYALLALSCVVTRVGQAIIVLIALPFDLLTLGKIEKLHTLVYRNLQAPAAILEVFMFTLLAVNPRAAIDDVNVSNI